MILVDRWWKVENYEILTVLVSPIQKQVPIIQGCWRFRARTTNEYGYAFPSQDHVVMKLVDDCTIYTSMNCPSLSILRLIAETDPDSPKHHEGRNCPQPSHPFHAPAIKASQPLIKVGILFPLGTTPFLKIMEVQPAANIDSKNMPEISPSSQDASGDRADRVE